MQTYAWTIILSYRWRNWGTQRLNKVPIARKKQSQHMDQGFGWRVHALNSHSPSKHFKCIWSEQGMCWSPSIGSELASKGRSHLPLVHVKYGHWLGEQRSFFNWRQCLGLWLKNLLWSTVLPYCSYSTWLFCIFRNGESVDFKLLEPSMMWFFARDPTSQLSRTLSPTCSLHGLLHLSMP